jgi:hypothetical protein
MAPGSIVSPKYTEDWVKQNLLTPKQSSVFSVRGLIAGTPQR